MDSTHSADRLRSSFETRLRKPPNTLSFTLNLRHHRLFQAWRMGGFEPGASQHTRSPKGHNETALSPSRFRAILTLAAVSSSHQQDHRTSTNPSTSDQFQQANRTGRARLTLGPPRCVSRIVLRPSKKALQVKITQSQARNLARRSENRRPVL
jgi:hypothetical protein